MADAEQLQIRQHGGRVRKREILVELQAIGGDRRRRRDLWRVRTHCASLPDGGSGSLGQRAARRDDSIHRAIELAPPIGVSGVGAWQIGLPRVGEDILELQGDEHGRRLGDVAERRRDGRLAGACSLDLDARVGQSAREPGEIAFALPALAHRLLVRVDAVFFAQRRIEAAPPAGEGRQIMRRDRGKRFCRVGRRRLERAVALTLEGQDAIAQDVRAHDRVGEAVRRRAEILGDDQGSRAVALDAENGEHRLERVVEIHALRRGQPVRHDVEALQLEGMVDADRSGMTHVAGDKRAKRE